MWDGSLKPRSFKNIKGGIYTEEFMYNEYEKYLNNEDSIECQTEMTISVN